MSVTGRMQEITKLLYSTQFKYNITYWRMKTYVDFYNVIIQPWPFKIVENKTYLNLEYKIWSVNTDLILVYLMAILIISNNIDDKPLHD